jgi:exodeoxyribonuclease VII large subunit
MSSILTNAAEYTVSEIAGALRRTVEEEFGNVRVRGEISGFRGQHSSGHAYFTLKDADASLDAVIWKTAWPRLAFKPQEGLEIIATGRLTTFPRSSKYQIVIEQIQPAGAGALMALLEERRKKLAAEGLFAKERKRPLPYLPRVIGVVTSPTGAVIRDILHRIADRFPSHVLVWPVRVQGETTAGEVSAAIAGFNRFVPGGIIPRPDLLIVARGGGSIEDLWGFNEEAVVRAVAASAIPVITAVGHETDTTLVDHASDHRAPTPTAAAEAAVPVRAELIGYVDELGQRGRQSTRRTMTSDRNRLRAAAAALPRPLELLALAQQRLDRAASRLEGALRQTGQRKRVEFEKCGGKLRPLLLESRARDLGARLDQRGGQLLALVERGMERRRSRLTETAAHLTPRVLREEIRHGRARLVPCIDRLAPSIAAILDSRARRLDSAGKLLDSYSYRNVLARGFALVTDAEGNIVRAPAEVRPGDPLVIELAEGNIAANVSGAPAIPRRRRPKRPAEESGQESLF